ncbi:hypothetical protein PHJA_000812400 [Phtheirospermum japonicum]|uniref:Uncharacterized protein n=1 Tax=Phtheirospermum japonicum TaxID=374723 RepID=A0A830BII6_9LAMI|nr:hypothetical protein PHJA_000812400 [Phtheirospermum japonicum]
METKTTNFHVIYLFLYLHFTCSTKCLKENSDESLDTTFHDSAFRALIHHHHPQTGTLYNTILPKNVSGIKVSFLRLRSRTLWQKGANFSNFIIPPKTRPVLHVKRILIVYHNLGNWSSLYYNVSGYAHKPGHRVFNASNLDLSKLIELNNTLGKPVSVEFQNSTLATNRRRFCASFGSFGKFTLTEMSFSDNVCYSENEGHFSIVVPFEKKQKKVRPFWIMGFAAGLVGVAGTVAVGSFVRWRNQEMEKEADGECLETYWIGDSKMPRLK